MDCFCLVVVPNYTIKNKKTKLIQGIYSNKIYNFKFEFYRIKSLEFFLKLAVFNNCN